MAKWDSKTEAAKESEAALKIVDSILGFVKDGKGKPSNDERALFAAAVVFSYGVWESYVETLAVEVVNRLIEEIDPAAVPERIHSLIEKQRSVWELAVSPGWKRLWVQLVERKAVGDEENYGLNSAGPGQVRNLLRLAGVEDCFDCIDDNIVPDHLTGAEGVIDAVEQLVRLRGEIVHTAVVPDALRKSHVAEWRNFVQDLLNEVDKCSRLQAEALTS